MRAAASPQPFSLSQCFILPAIKWAAVDQESKRERFATSFLDLNQSPGATRHRRCVRAPHLKVGERFRSSPLPASW